MWKRDLSKSIGGGGQPVVIMNEASGLVHGQLAWREFKVLR